MYNVISKEPVRDYTGKIIGYIETDRDGNQQVRDFFGRILGGYDKNLNITKDFYGRQLTKGNTCIGLLYKNIKL